MEIKRPDEITKEEIPYIEHSRFAAGRVRRLFERYDDIVVSHQIKGLNTLVREAMDRHQSLDIGTPNEFFDNHDLFKRKSPIKDEVLSSFSEGEYLIVYSPNDPYVDMRCSLFAKRPALAADDEWQQFGFADTRNSYIRFESILNRIYKNRLPYDSDIYGFIGGGGSGVSKTETEPKEIVLTPEPWPNQEKTGEESTPPEKTSKEHEETLLEAIKEYLGRVARGEILEENLARYEDLLERSRAGDTQASRDMINEFAGFGSISKVGKLAKESKSVDGGKNKRPNQVHHYATNKSKKYTRELKRVADKYNLDLDDLWNKESLPHQGRHPDAYHDFVLKGMKRAHKEAKGDKAKFLNLFDKYIKEPVRQNPDLLRKKGWE